MPTGTGTGTGSETDPEVKRQVLRALTDAVKASLSGMALVEAHPIPPKSAKRSRSPVCWSWIKLEQPCSGQLVVLQPLEFGRIIGEVMTGLPPEDIPDEDVLDAQTELTNVIAGRFLQAFADSDDPPSLGLPRCGRGAPDVRRGEWIGQVYQVGDWWVALFITGRDVIGKKASVRMTSLSAEVRASAALDSIHRDESREHARDDSAYEPNTMHAPVRPGSATMPIPEGSSQQEELPTLPRQREPDPAVDEIEVELPPGHKDSGEVPVRDSVLLSAQARPVPVVRLEDFIKEHPAEFPGAASDVYLRHPVTAMPEGTTARTDLHQGVPEETRQITAEESRRLAAQAEAAAADPEATMPMGDAFRQAAAAAGRRDGTTSEFQPGTDATSSGSSRLRPVSTNRSSSSTFGGDAMEVGLGEMIGDGDFLIPSRLGNYRIIEEIGSGGMATVFRGEHATLLRQVAIKVLKPSLAMDQAFITGFLQEARNAARVEHPNVVPVYDADEVDGYLYIVLRLVPSGDLSTRVSCHGVLSEEEACMVFRACCAGLQAIAEAGLMHRDIKPSNILIGEDGSPLIGDLGLTRPAALGASRSKAAGAIGTPSYMAPEQIEQDPDLDIRCDIYGLGGTLYTAVTGRPPYRGKTAAETITKVIREPVPDPRDHAPDLSDDFAKLIMRAMAKERADRFQNPNEFARALDACLKRFDSPSRGRGWFARLLRG